MDNKSKDNEELMADFIHNRLNEEELVVFNEKIKKDKQFAERFALVSALNIGITEGKLERTKLKEELLKKVRKSRRRKFIKIAIIALMSLSLMLIAIYYFWMGKKQLSEPEKSALMIALNEQIKQEYAINIASANTENNWIGPEFIFHNKIDEGLTKMSNFLKKSSSNTEHISFYYGASLLLYKNKCTKAIPFLLQAIEPNSDYKREAYFYLVIAYTLDKKIDKAKYIIENQSLSLTGFPESIQQQLR